MVLHPRPSLTPLISGTSRLIEWPHHNIHRSPRAGHSRGLTGSIARELALLNTTIHPPPPYHIHSSCLVAHISNLQLWLLLSRSLHGTPPPPPQLINPTLSPPIFPAPVCCVPSHHLHPRPLPPAAPPTLRRNIAATATHNYAFPPTTPVKTPHLKYHHHHPDNID